MCLLMQLYQSSLSEQELWNEIQQSSQCHAQQGLKQIRLFLDQMRKASLHECLLFPTTALNW